MRRRRTALIQLSAWHTSRLLHLPGGDPEIAARDGSFAAFPERFGWIHGFGATTAAAAA